MFRCFVYLSCCFVVGCLFVVVLNKWFCLCCVCRKCLLMLCWWGQLILTIITFVRRSCCVCSVVPCGDLFCLLSLCLSLLCWLGHFILTMNRYVRSLCCDCVVVPCVLRCCLCLLIDLAFCLLVGSVFVLF